MKCYVYLDEYNKVNAISFSETEQIGERIIELPVEYGNNVLIGYKYENGLFTQDDSKEVPETTEVTNADLLEVLLAIGEKVGA